MRVAVVWNHDHAGVINRFGQPVQEVCDRQEVESLLAALQEGGHETLLCEGDKELLATLERFMPPDPQSRPSGIVFNRASGIQGESRFSQVPAMLELAGVPYTGSSPLGHGLSMDKLIAKTLIRDRGVPTPNFRVMRNGTDSTGDLRFPLVVKSRCGTSSFGLQLAHEPAQLDEAVEIIRTRYRQDALVEEYIEGREITVALLGNDELELLPLVEQDFGDRKIRMMTWEAKFMADGPQKICPAQIGSKLAARLRDVSVASFHACQCRDYARVDFRIDHSGQPFVLDVNADPALGMGTSYPLAAMAAGYSFSNLVNRILDVAHVRYFGVGIPKA
ncbi:hypothetical protein CN311_03155 [Mesorhizobium sanjuanii]|uniref:ATP-grasp domain-containing protein n=1 Tax=Mesorhizobium sanjuanii TaxID=2037900 RepID=A0A2A6FMA1_9HYPH|nr:ATP-grasp domain-containing protein [Mesorhizobium sanjuanii]PDQ22588.1 hypothetical protein CN311_03155 [Mesorhizobium sanjuanii]